MPKASLKSFCSLAALVFVKKANSQILGEVERHPSIIAFVLVTTEKSPFVKSGV